MDKKTKIKLKNQGFTGTNFVGIPENSNDQFPFHFYKKTLDFSKNF